MKRLFFIACILLIGLPGKSQVVIDTFLTDYARLLAAKPCLSEPFKKIQAKSFYAGHKNLSEKVWGHVHDSTIARIDHFTAEKGITSPDDTLTCFYPFGGPDFLFANVFYPKAKNYVLMGLERPGSVTDVTKKSDQEVELLLDHLNQSMAYLNKSGYFVTSHMSRDFSKSLLNGTIHPVLYFAANRGLMVKKLQHGYINASGNFVAYKSPKEKQQYYNGYCLTLTDSSGHEQNVYYFSADIADYKIKTFPWFVKFVKGMGMDNCFIKSASYIPAHKNFSIVRNLILDNSHKIIQDDTGIQYKILKDETKWKLEFWGIYTMTIKDLSWGFQEDLKEAVKKSPNNKKLPFRITYNGNYGEGILMYAVRK
jgi:hypothetical protein